MARFNAANPATAVQVGDIFESVNGASGDMRAIANAVKSAAALDLLVHSVRSFRVLSI